MSKRRIPSPWLGRGATDDDLDRYWGDEPEEEAEPDWEQMIADKEQADE